MRSLALATLIVALAANQASAAVRPPARPDRPTRAVSGRMAVLPAGSYRPLYAPASAPPTRVARFALERDAVTRGEYLAFVATHPEWRRSRVRRDAADVGYLADWASDTVAGDAVALRRPVTSVSWFAARAYCAAQGKRLPTVDEWEYAAAASERRTDASDDPAFRARLVALYARIGDRPGAASRSFVNAFGVRGLHGVVWEWTLDFDGGAHDHAHDGHAAADARHPHLWCASAAIGAADPTNYPAFQRYAVRAGLATRATTSTLGFRCAADAPVR